MLVKGISIKHESEEIRPILNRYIRMLQDFVDLAIEKDLKSLSRLNGYRQEIREKYNIGGSISVMAMRDALSIYRQYKRHRRNPTVDKKFLKVALGYNVKLINNSLQITISRNEHITIPLTISKYHKKLIDQYDLGEIVVREHDCVFTIKKEYTPKNYDGVLTLDINEKSIDGAILKDNKIEFAKWDLSEIYRINSTTFEKVRRIFKKYPNKWRMLKRLSQVYYTNRNRRINWHLHNILNDIVKLAEKKNLLIVMEDLKNLTRGINKRAKNGCRRLRRSLLGRLNRAVFNKIQFMVDYKAKWKDLQVKYKNSYNTSKRCPKCGEIGERTNWHIFKCKNCGLIWNVHQIACLNLLKLVDESLRFGDNWQPMTLPREVASASQ